MAKNKKQAAPVTATAPVDDTTQVEQTETEVSAEADEVNQTKQLTIPDLQLIARIIDLASRRGAFQAAELTQVGTVFDNLTAFLAYVEEMSAPKCETTEATE